MAAARHETRALLREALIGAGLGLLILGAGGRAVMRAIALFAGAPAAISVGGTLTVLAAGAAAGAAGVLLHALSRMVATRVVRGRGRMRDALHLALFASLLVGVTARGLHGSPPRQAMGFWPLVLVYGVLLVRVLARRSQASSIDGTPLPGAATAG